MTNLSNQSFIRLNDNNLMPALGLGTWQSKEGAVDAIKTAIKDVGYRHIDTAYLYMNEAEVGQALKELFDEGVVKREEVWVTSKLWSTFHRPDLVEAALDNQLKRLQLDCLDLYLIHWPQALKEDKDLIPKDKDGNWIMSDVDPLDTWKAMIELKKTGKVRSIGVSNFSIEQLERLIKETGVAPAVNQVECHPYLPQKELLKYANKSGIHLTAYSPLGNPDRPQATDAEPVLMDEPVVHEIARKHKKSVAQILIKFNLQRGLSCIPKSSNPTRIKQNADVFNFQLAPEDVNALENLKTSHRYFHMKALSAHAHYPF